MLSLKGAGTISLLTGSFDPSSIDDLGAWWKTDVGVTDISAGSISNGEEVGGWADQSGNGHDLVNRFNIGPIYDDATYAFPVLKFGVASVVENMTKTTGNIQSSNQSIIMACIPIEGGVDPTGYYFSSTGGGGAGNEHLQNFSNTAGVSANLRFKSNGSYSMSVPFASPTYYQIDCDGTNGDTQGYVENVQQFTNIYAYGGQTGFIVGNERSGVNCGSTYVMEVLVYGHVLTSGERDDISAYLEDKYSI